ncbi:MAG TPA: xanthine dehydrogenase family protein subunit M [Burkholderiales bacterium]|jgi:carbon-monoxide dehydrogenase medium subunit
MYALSYQRAKSLEDAATLLAAEPEAKLMAGGQTLIPTLKARLAQPSHLVDLARVKELQGIELKGGVLSIGAMTRHFDVMSSPVVQKAIPGLANLASLIGDLQVRNRGTMGGSIANNDPAADYPAGVLAHNTTIVTNRREIAADDYFQGMFATALEEGEIIIRLDWPVPKQSAYSKFEHPASGYAMAGTCIAQLADGSVRVGVTGAGSSGAFRWTEAEEALAKSFSLKSLEGLKIDPENCLADLHAPAEYRAHLVGVMATRALQKML